jgi:hypothetical protein
MRSYTRDRWLLVKLHGSVDWVRYIELPPLEKAPSDLPGKREKLLDALDRFGLHFGSSPIVLARPSWYDWLRPIEDHMAKAQYYFHYPVLAVPADGKYEPQCPPAHLSALQDWLPSCRNVLIIGASGRDDDLFREVLDHMPELAQYHVVGYPADATDAAASNYREKVRAFQELGTDQFVAYGNGFTRYLSDRKGLYTFIANANGQ